LAQEQAKASCAHVITTMAASQSTDHPEVLLEDTWEAEDVIEECAKRGISCTEMTVDELKAVDPPRFAKSTYMCSTEIVQAHLKTVNGSGGDEVAGKESSYFAKVPGTYPIELQPLFRRKIEQRKLETIGVSELPLFVKPMSNDKAFDGTVVANDEQLKDLIESINSDSSKGTSADTIDVYTAEVVKFSCEYRLFVGAGRLYGTGKIRDDRTMGASEQEGNEEVEKEGNKLVITPSCVMMNGGPSSAFMAEVIALCGEKYMAVDVGLMTKPGGDDKGGDWSLVEVNPPFSLDDHGLPIGPYMDYCVDACKWIRE